VTDKTVMRYSPKYARDGAKIVRCALDQSSKVGDLIRCANYIYMLWVIKHLAQGYTVQNTREVAQRLIVALWIKVQKSEINSMRELYIYFFSCQASGAMLLAPGVIKPGICI
jgi:hypothetical protein